MNQISIFIIILLLLSLINCQKDTSPLNGTPSEFTSSDDSHVPISVRSLYRLDASYLALNHIYKNKLPDTSSGDIPEHLIDPFYAGLIHIYNCKSIKSVDTITKTSPIHSQVSKTLLRFNIGIDTSYSWTKQWLDGNILTGNDTIDNLLIKYNLKPETTNSTISKSVSLLSEKPLNTRYLLTIFDSISGVTYAEPAILVGISNHISAQMESSSIKYNFFMGWGDCPSGCLYGHSWELTVSNEGEVRLISSYGDELDEEHH